ncbi:MAG: hypothetical protein ACJ8FY_15215 [Gemmataceae bacterium]
MGLTNRRIMSAGGIHGRQRLRELSLRDGASSGNKPIRQAERWQIVDVEATRSCCGLKEADWNY